MENDKQSPLTHDATHYHIKVKDISKHMKMSQLEFNISRHKIVIMTKPINIFIKKKKELPKKGGKWKLGVDKKTSLAIRFDQKKACT